MNPLDAILLQRSVTMPGTYTAECLVTGVRSQETTPALAASAAVEAVAAMLATGATSEAATHYTVWKGPLRAAVLERARDALGCLTLDERAAIMGVLLAEGEMLASENERLASGARRLRTEVARLLVEVADMRPLARAWEAIQELNREDEAGVIALADAVEKARVAEAKSRGQSEFMDEDSN